MSKASNHLVFAPLAAALLGSLAVAQTTRTVSMQSPAVLGQTANFTLKHSASLAGRLYFLAACAPTYPGAAPVSIPGVTGVLRIDLATTTTLVIGFLNASGTTPALPIAVPNDLGLLGFSFDIQGADLDPAGLVTLTTNDQEVTLAAPPPANLNMVAIAPGNFQMGSSAPTNQPPYYNEPNAQPVHTVTISKPFWIGKYEVTQNQYVALMGTNPSFFQGPSYPNSGNRPVDSVLWVDAVAYCNALSAQEAAAGRLPSGYVYRLPTEAEWEYCCRAGSGSEFCYGASLNCTLANVNNNGYCVVGTANVGSYPANAWGLHDMHGNIYEWCLDRWDGNANYPAGAVQDPFVSTGPGHVIRGGYWAFRSPAARSASRTYGIGDENICGLRVVLAPIL